MFCLLIMAFVAGAFAAHTHPPHTTAGIDIIPFITQAFYLVDLDHNGQADVNEWMGLFATYDANHDGKVTLQEYRAATKVDKVLGAEVFKFLDDDGDDVLDRGDMNRIFRMYDSNHDGIINIQEFITEYSRIYLQIVKDLPPGYTFNPNPPTTAST